MASTNPYKDLVLLKEKLKPLMEEFKEAHQINIILKSTTSAKEVYLLSKVGMEDGLFEIYHTNKGKTTLNATGKNKEIGEKLASFLASHVAEEKGRINMTLTGYEYEHILPIVELMLDKKTESDQQVFEFTKTNEPHAIRFDIVNLIDKDSLQVTVYNSKKVVIKGLPLSCYHEFIFQFSILLDAKGLAYVVSRTDESCIQVIENKTVLNNLEAKLDGTFPRIPKILQDMLISGASLKSVSFNLPDYSCFLYAELRALEGVLKDILGSFDDIDLDEKTIGEHFDKISVQKFTLSAEYCSIINNKLLSDALSDAYSFFNHQRHTLFHVNNIVVTTRILMNFDQVLSLTDEVYSLIKNLYKAMP
ncbi:type II toxin-antitoxin system RnlA family toxin [Acinetobacter sp. yr461]|uniref:type II toxin-antitoxin system RnlA family toxin n=1 Tax=Acinetobacter sp. yr461 TaxID=1761742 RepID=UPI0008D303F8|nr:type II toxin-antitoxin system RnlA family toxin [Acinetobacter sp. yr461]SEO66217.1 RNase LS, toxin [Acinetobacter sp. yr461]